MINILLTIFKIFIARAFDVSLGTIKTIFIVREKRIISSTIAFFEVFIWFFAAKSALNISANPYIIALFYSLGYASGTYIGTLISSKYIKSNVILEIISNKVNLDDATKVSDNIYIIKTNKKDIKKYQDIIYKQDNNAYIFIKDYLK